MYCYFFKSIYDISEITVGGSPVLISDFKRKVIITVNVASDRSLGKNNYEHLVELKKQYPKQGFFIIGIIQSIFKSSPKQTSMACKQTNFANS